MAPSCVCDVVLSVQWGCHQSEICRVASIFSEKLPSSPKTMGCEASVPVVQQVSMTAQPRPVVAFDARHCTQDFLTLKENDKIFQNGRTYLDTSTGREYFFIRFGGLSPYTTLQDSSKVAIGNYRYKLAIKPTLVVRPGDSHGKEGLFEIYARYLRRGIGEARVLFPDRLTGEQCVLTVEGNWRARQAAFYLDRGVTGENQLVAMIYSPQGAVAGIEYNLTIVPNMDAALVVMVCSILDDAQLKEGHYI